MGYNDNVECIVQHTPAAFNAVKLDMVVWVSLSVMIAVAVRLQKEKKRIVWLQV